jgi:hypothetical protein
MARGRGLSTRGYWLAWIVSWAAGGVVFTAVVIMTAVPSHDLWPNTKVVIGAVLLIGAITGAGIWSDLRADGPYAKAG